MDIPIKPIFLLADSQLLFWRNDDGELFLDRVRALISAASPKAAYVGASNGDQPEFYELFKGAMEGIGITSCRMIPSEPSREDLEFFDEADVILLAGGDVRQGWGVMKKNGVKQKLIERYYSGAVLMGVSAGAVQLGLHGVRESDTGVLKLFDTFKLVPLLVDAHEEPDWHRLHQVLPRAEESVRGLGIPSGAGAVLHPDLTLEAVRRPLVELSRGEDGLVQTLIFPPGPGEPEAEEVGRERRDRRGDGDSRNGKPSQSKAAAEPASTSKALVPEIVLPDDYLPN